MGRFELISKDPFLILDGAHNPDGAAALKKSLEIYFPAQRFCYIFGVFRDKEYQKILDEMLPLASNVYTVKAAGERGSRDRKVRPVRKKYPGAKLSDGGTGIAGDRQKRTQA